MSVLKYIQSSVPRDEVRDMLIASADYNIVAQNQEILHQPNNNRKRRGSLNGLSLEEKILRKKLKNREAAQNSRDKKKVYVTNLESAITVLQEENLKLSKKVLKLIEENKTLKEHNEKIEKELLEVKIAKKEEKTTVERECIDISVIKGDERSAEPNPQQKGLLPLIALNQIISIHCLILMTSTGLMKQMKLSISMNCLNLLILFQKKLWNWRQRIKLLKWWGPMQKSWNPLGTLTWFVH